MISKNKLKFIKSLEIKKFRRQHEQFIVQGKKSVHELLRSDYAVSELYIHRELEKEFVEYFDQVPIVEFVTEKELERLGTFTSNDSCLAIAEIKEAIVDYPSDEWFLVLDEVRDPGNFGTIIRAADWYGIRKVICSPSCVDVFNPKVIAATMGSFSRVAVCYTDLKGYLSGADSAVVGALLGGASIYDYKFGNEGLILMGNESKGVGEELLPFVTPIEIPRLGGAESLNVAMATTVFLDNLARS